MRLSLNDIKTTKNVAIPLGPKTAVRFIATSQNPIAISTVSESGEVNEIMHIPAHTTMARAIVINEQKELLIESKGSFGLAYATANLTIGESQDHEPPPAPPAADNLLAQIREKVRREMGVTREGFLLQNDTGFPGHEIDDDEDEIFEEEIQERKQRQEKEAALAADEEKQSAAPADDNNPGA